MREIKRIDIVNKATPDAVLSVVHIRLCAIAMSM